MAENIAQVNINAEQFLALPDNDERAQLIAGERVVSPPPLVAHVESVSQCFALIVLLTGTGTGVYTEPATIHYDETNVFQPDVFWVAPDNDRFRVVDGRYFAGPPDLVIEVLSPSTEKVDRGVKFDTYEKHAVREYWLASPQARFIEVYVHTNDHFARLGIFGDTETFVSTALGDKTIAVSKALPPQAG